MRFVSIAWSVALLTATVRAVCCEPDPDGLCADGSEGTPCCGNGGCNIACCNCDGGESNPSLQALNHAPDVSIFVVSTRKRFLLTQCLSRL